LIPSATSFLVLLPAMLTWTSTWTSSGKKEIDDDGRRRHHFHGCGFDYVWKMKTNIYYKIE
jgi:hypothetical protein